MNKFRIVCALVASVIIMAAPTWSPGSGEHDGAGSAGILAES